jgi:hypothetical protein
METNAEMLMAVAVLVVTALAAFAVYRWRQQRYVRQVKRWVEGYLSTRYGELPNHLNINCSDDRLWPVLVAFDHPRTGLRHSLQVACWGPQSTFSLLSEKEETR